jgi:hypothetical protein
MPNGEDGGHLLILFDGRKNLPLRHGGTEKRLIGKKPKGLGADHGSSRAPQNNLK